VYIKAPVSLLSRPFVKIAFQTPPSPAVGCSGL
jgi:hypothetical protein